MWRNYLRLRKELPERSRAGILGAHVELGSFTFPKVGVEKISNIWDIRKSTQRHITSVLKQISQKTILFPSTMHKSKLQRDKIVSKWFIPVPKQSSKSFKRIKRRYRTQRGKSFNGSVQFSHSIMSSSLQPHGLQHSRFPCLSPTLRACSNSCPLSRWWHPTISSSVVPFSFLLQSFPASVSFPESVLCIR